ncbi:hypothetical protein [Dysgonomonas reticulitermitis]|nr:hypothetical protein FACS1894169_14420 [Bacteroidia bacterium]
MNRKKTILIAIVATVSMSIAAQVKQITVEKGLPVTFTAQKKSYTIEKCEITYDVDRFISIQVSGEGFGMSSLDKKGQFPITCSYASKGKEYYFNFTRVEKTSVVFLLTQNVLPYPESITFYPKRGKKVKVKIE